MNTASEQRPAIERLAQEAAALREHADAIDALILELEAAYGPRAAAPKTGPDSE